MLCKSFVNSLIWLHEDVWMINRCWTWCLLWCDVPFSFCFDCDKLYEVVDLWWCCWYWCEYAKFWLLTVNLYMLNVNIGYGIACILNYVVEFLYANLMVIVVVLVCMKGVCLGDELCCWIITCKWWWYWWRMHICKMKVV